MCSLSEVVFLPALKIHKKPLNRHGLRIMSIVKGRQLIPIPNLSIGLPPQQLPEYLHILVQKT